MKNTFTAKACIVLLFLAHTALLRGQENPAATNPDFIREEKFIPINGIEQWVTIRGDRSKQVILFLHGGPGSPISPYSETLYGAWEKDFIIVQWDQRGTGKTYGKHAPEELTPAFLAANPLSVDQMTADGIAVTEYLAAYLNKPKVILFGTSWGSVLGVRMATKRPDLFYAYVGHSQVVEPDSDVQLYEKVYRMAQKTKDGESLETLNAIGKPPYNRARNVGQLLKIVKKYERARSTPAPDAWFEPASGYDNPEDNQHRSDGDDYSFVNYAGDSRLGVPAMRATVHFLAENPAFGIPVYLIQGKEDLLTPRELTRKFFKGIRAPKKKYILLRKTAHGFNPAVLEAQYKIFRRIKV